MKVILFGIVAILSLSLRTTNPVKIEIVGSPKCLKPNKDYTIRLMLPGELSTDEDLLLSGIGISLSKKNGAYLYNGRTSWNKGVIQLSASIWNKKNKTSEPVSKLEITVCE